MEGGGVVQGDKKYGIHEGDDLHFREKKRASYIWKGIPWSSDLLYSGLRRLVGNGKKTRS